MADQNSIPPPPAGFVPATSGSAPPPPPGFTPVDSASNGQPTEQQRYQAATEEGSLWRKILGMNPDGETLRKHGFSSDSYNEAENKYKEVTAGELARGSAGFNPATQKIYNAGEHNSVVRGAEKGFTETLSGTSQLAGKAADKVGLRSQSENGQPKGIFGEAPATEAETKPEGVGEHVGYIGGKSDGVRPRG